MTTSAGGEKIRISHVLLMGKPTRVAGGAGVAMFASPTMTPADRRAHYETLKKKVLDDLVSRWQDRLVEHCRISTFDSPYLPDPMKETDIDMFIRAVLAREFNDPSPAYTYECIRMGPPWLFFLFLAILVHAD